MKKTSILSMAVLMLLTLGLGTRSQAQYKTIGSGTILEQLPLSIAYYHNLTQLIYTNSEMGSDPIRIYSIAFHQKANVAGLTSQRRHVKVYMTMSSRSSYSSNTDWNPSGSLYYDGYFYTSDGDEWTTIDLQSPFIYTGSNLIITIIDDMDESLDYETDHRFYCSSTSGYTSLTKCRDNGAFSTSDLSSSTSGTRYQKRPNTRFFTTPNAITSLPYIEIGSGATTSSTSSVLPTYSYFKNECSEQIFTTAELGGSGTLIYGVQFYQVPSSSVNELRRKVKVYLSSMSSSIKQYSSTTAWTNVISSELLYTGGYVLDDAAGWRTIWFDTPKTINSSYNYALVMVDSNNTYQNGHQFAVHETGGNASLYVYSDGTSYDATTLYGNTTTTGTLSNKRNNVRFITASNVTPPTMTCSISGNATGQPGASMTFTATSNYNATFSWSIQGGTPSTATGNVATATWSTPGTYTVTLTATVGNKTATATKTVTINSDLSCSINGSSTGQTGTAMTFTANGPTGATYSWNLQGATPATATGSTATATWNTAGTYTVTLTATKDGQNATATKTVTISEAPLTCSISGPSAGQTGSAMTFTASGTSGATFSWNLQGATPATATGSTATATWNTAGTYTVTLTATKGSQTKTATKNVTITATQAPLECSIEGSSAGVVGYPMTFIANGPSDATFNWSFIGGTPATATGFAASSVWLTPGTYVVSLIASRGGESATATLNVTITGDNVGIDDAEFNEVIIYPNPTSGILNVKAEGLERVEVLDMTGRTLVTTNDSSINLKGTPAGVYMVRIYTVNGTAVRRVTVR